MASADIRVLLPAPLLVVFGLCLYGFTTTYASVDQAAQPTLRVVYACGAGLSIVVLTVLLTFSILADNKRRPG